MSQSMSATPKGTAPTITLLVRPVKHACTPLKMNVHADISVAEVSQLVKISCEFCSPPQLLFHGRILACHAIISSIGIMCDDFLVAVSSDDEPSLLAPLASAGEKTGANKRKERLEACIICFDEFPSETLLSAQMDSEDVSGEPVFGSRGGSVGCGHQVCRRCLRQYVLGIAEERKADVLCPYPDCDAEVQLSICEELLGTTSDSYRKLERAKVESYIRNKVYCCNTECSVALEGGGCERD